MDNLYADPQPEAYLSGHTDTVTSVAFSPDGKTLASGSHDQSIILWNVETRKSSQRLRVPLNLVFSLAFSPDGKTLASGASGLSDKTIILWNVATGQPIGQPLQGHTDTVTSIVFSPDGKMLASGSYDHNIILWDLSTRQPIGQPLEGHTNIVTSVALALTEKLLLQVLGMAILLFGMWRLTSLSVNPSRDIPIAWPLVLMDKSLLQAMMTAPSLCGM